MAVLETYTIVVQRPDGEAFEAELQGQGVRFADKLQAETFAKQLADKEDVHKVLVMKSSVFRIFRGKGYVEQEKKS